MFRKDVNNLAIKILTASVILLVVGITIMLTDAPAVSADNSLCTGSHSNSTFDNIVVPEGATCKIDRFNVVGGNIKVEEGASLIICPDNEIGGNIKAHAPDTVFISDLLTLLCAPPNGAPPKALGITIGGNIDIKDANSFSLVGNPVGVTVVGGNVKVTNTQNVNIENFSGIAGNLEVKNNVNVLITGNTIGGNLKIRGTAVSCTGDGTNNSVGGNVDPCP